MHNLFEEKGLLLIANQPYLQWPKDISYRNWGNPLYDKHRLVRSMASF
jgi:hypothetical protein